MNRRWYPTLATTDQVTLYPTTKLQHLTILEALASPTGTGIEEVTESFTAVAGQDEYLLRFYPLDPGVSGHFLATSGGADLTPVPFEQATIGTSEIGARGGNPRVRIDGDEHDGNTIEIVYKTAMTAITPTLFGELWGNVVEMQAEVGRSFSGTLDPGLGYSVEDVCVTVNPSGYLIPSQPNEANAAIYFLSGQADPGDEVNVTRQGLATVLGYDFPFIQLFAGQGGKITWYGDQSANKLVQGNLMVPVGRMVGAAGSGQLLLDIGWGVRFMT